MNFENLELKVIEWTKDRKIFERSSARSQMIKLIEEQIELFDALYASNEEAIIDSIGDMMVVLTLIAKFSNTNLTFCYSQAYNKIKDRKGTMINGVFVKESN